ncbi:Cupredoxin [Peniophora sp. CONT]|nr:Cupredoxin [Peniophora sp. CONT]
MRFSTALFALPALAASVLAQTQDHQVMVGQTGLTFSPSSVTAAAGDTVTFVFFPKNHTVTQSTFAAPCTKMDGGIASGFQPVTADQTSVPAMTITVNDTTPLWFFCGQKTPVSHCGMGMVFAVNPTAEKSFATFQTAANATLAASNTTTTGTTSTNGTSTGTAASGTAASGTAASGAASPSASTTTSGANASGALSMGAHAGAILATVGLAFGMLL